MKMNKKTLKTILLIILGLWILKKLNIFERKKGILKEGGNQNLPMCIDDSLTPPTNPFGYLFANVLAPKDYLGYMTKEACEQLKKNRRLDY